MVETALITGASGNLGRAVAAVLAARGWRLMLLDRQAAGLVETLSGEGHAVQTGVDLTDRAACAAAVAETMARFGRLDGVVHTVGGFAMGGIADTAAFQTMFRVNLLTTANLLGVAIAAMRGAGRGSLVAIGAMAALRSPAEMGAYTASKSGVMRLVEAAAAEVKAEGLRVNALLPGTMDTPQNRAAMPDADPTAWVTPTQVAEAAAFLLSDAASGVTGALLPVTGKG